MGASPSRESSPLFSYFRGSYETGLIPLTKHFFGREEDQQRHANTSAMSGRGGGFHQSYNNNNNNNSYSRAGAGGPFSSYLSLDERQALRRQLLQVRRDPAILYNIARDPLTMRKTMLKKLRQMKVATADLVNNSVGKSGGVDECLTREGEAGDAQNTTTEAILDAENDAAVTDLEWAKLLEELGLSTDEAERLMHENFWEVIPENNFTEADLDHFLDLVDDMMYETDEDMILDPRYQNDSPHGPQPPEGTSVSNLAGGETHDKRRYPRVYAPVPCALCLAYPPAKARECCFPLEGRYINIIGFFGCLTPEMQRAFKVMKCSMNIAEEVERNGLTCPCQGRTPEATSEPPPCGSGCPHAVNQKNVLYLNTAILTSVGDRTLERVLALSAVMLRQQFHTASRRVLMLQRRRRAQQQQHQQPSPLPSLSSGYTPPGSTPRRVTQSPVLTDAEERAIFLTPLPAAPPGIFTPQQSCAFVSSPGDMPSSAASGYTSAADASASPALAGVMPFAAMNPSGTVFSEADENQITWNFYHRLDQLSVVVHTASNNYSALKSLTENLAFLHSQLRINPDDGVVRLLDLPEESNVPETPRQSIDKSAASPEEMLDIDGTKADATPTTAEEKESPSGTPPHPLSPSSLVVLHVNHRYLAQSTLWASGLLHYPQLKGKWIQYKLKDESEVLRQTLRRKDDLIAAWRRTEKEQASSYLGPLTTRLLNHVRCLQKETDRVRSLNPEQWVREVHADRDGRKYALYPSVYGTMLIGVRSKAGGAEGGAETKNDGEKGNHKMPKEGEGSKGSGGKGVHRGTPGDLGAAGASHLDPHTHGSAAAMGGSNGGGLYERIDGHPKVHLHQQPSALLGRHGSAGAFSDGGGSGGGGVHPTGSTTMMTSAFPYNAQMPGMVQGHPNNINDAPVMAFGQPAASRFAPPNAMFSVGGGAMMNGPTSGPPPLPPPSHPFVMASPDGGANQGVVVGRGSVFAQNQGLTPQLPSLGPQGIAGSSSGPGNGAFPPAPHGFKYVLAPDPATAGTAVAGSTMPSFVSSPFGGSGSPNAYALLPSSTNGPPPSFMPGVAGSSPTSLQMIVQQHPTNEAAPGATALTFQNQHSNPNDNNNNNNNNHTTYVTQVNGTMMGASLLQDQTQPQLVPISPQPVSFQQQWFIDASGQMCQMLVPVSQVDPASTSNLAGTSSGANNAGPILSLPDASSPSPAPAPAPAMSLTSPFGPPTQTSSWSGPALQSSTIQGQAPPTSAQMIPMCHPQNQLIEGDSNKQFIASPSLNANGTVNHSNSLVYAYATNPNMIPQSGQQPPFQVIQFQNVMYRNS